MTNTVSATSMSVSRYTAARHIAKLYALVRWQHTAISPRDVVLTDNQRTKVVSGQISRSRTAVRRAWGLGRGRAAAVKLLSVSTDVQTRPWMSLTMRHVCVVSASTPALRGRGSPAVISALSPSADVRF